MTKPGDPTNPSLSDSHAETHELAAEAYCSACNQSFPIHTVVCPNDGARLIKLAAERDMLIGKVLDQRYEIRSPLGKGGMGTVYRGWQLSVDREVAIKVIHPKLSNDRSAVKRFLREARLASRLSQPNIVNVYDFGQSDGVLYLVMELLRGHTLAGELGKGRRLNPKRTVTIAAQLCDALEAAHAQGIVHRDLKPSNIVILDDPPGRDLIKVLDFGLAKSLAADAGSLVTNTDALLGTPLYMAPEMIDGRDSDQRADLYSFGCMLYEMLSGRPPFVDNGVSAVLARHMNDTHAELPAHVPVKLKALIDKLLEKNPEDRVQSAGEVHAVLDSVREATPAVGTNPNNLAITIPGMPDTIPDIAPGLAETFEATPDPASEGGADAVKKAKASVPKIETSAAEPAKPRRYAIITIIAIVPIAIVALVMFKTMGGATSKQEPVSAGLGSGTSLAAGSGSGSGSGSALQVANTPVDAGVVDAPIDASAVRPDASKKHRTPSKLDAGQPDIEFYPGK